MGEIPLSSCGGTHVNVLSQPKGKVVNHAQKEIDDICGIFSLGAKDVFVPEAQELFLNVKGFYH